MAVSMTAVVGKPEPERDRWGRYVALNADGEPEVYRRSTSVAHKLGDSQGLEYWGKTMIASGIGQKPDLYALAAAHPDPKLARSVYKEILEAAEEASGANAARRRGQALHALTEHLDLGATLESYGVDDGQGGLTARWELWGADGTPLLPVDADDAERLKLYRQTLEENGITIATEHVEQVLLLDSLRIAGTADRFGWTRDGRLVVLDVKTGSLEYGHLEWAAQLSMYANHDAQWCHVVGDQWERRPAIPGVDREWGVVIHLPATGEPSCTLHWLDLETGYGGLIYAAGLMEYRTLKVMAPFNGGVVPERMPRALPVPPDEVVELDEDGEAAAPVPHLTVVPDPMPAPAMVSQVEATPENLRAWLAERIRAVASATDKPGAVAMLMQRWPAHTVPQPLPEVLSPVQVEDVARLLDIVEREYVLPFAPARPGLTVAELKASQPPRPAADTKVAKKATTRKRTAKKAATPIKESK